MKLKIDKTIFAFTLIFSTFLIWSVVMTTLNQTSLSEQNKYSEVINKSGIQRMLSQKITLHIINYSRTNDISNKDEVEKLLSLFIKNKIDIEKFITTTKTETDNIYTPNKQYKDIDKFINMTSLFIKNHHEINMDEFYNYSQALLLKLDDAVSDFQNLSDLSLNEISNQQLYSEILLYIVILLEIIFIAYPIIKNRNKLVSELEKYVSLIDKEVITSSTDLTGQIIYVSDAFCEISGYERDELIGKNHSIVRHPDMDSSIYKDLWETIISNKTWTGEIKNLKKDGSFYWVEAIISPSYDIKGNKVGYTAVKHDITDKKYIEEISITDGLTNIYNRRHFDGVFPKVINSAKRKNELVSFLIMDIDHFKQYNDTYGHQMGDDVLIKVASAIKNSLNRAEDICFRLGGEEFGVIFKADSKKKAEEFANTIRENIENLHIEHSGNSASSFVTASMGLICKNANDIKDVDTVYKQGDDLLYEAKESGRNRVCFRD